jgi:hypothetical protein
MRNRTVMGIFDRPGDAEKVKEELIEAGIARHRILISRLVIDEEAEDSPVGRVPDPCVVSVVVRSPVDRQHIADLMLRHGARDTAQRSLKRR